MLNAEEITAAVTERVKFERRQFTPGPEPEPGANQEPEALPLTFEEILRQLNRNADGDTFIFIELHRGLFVYDCASGRWYKWGGHFWIEDLTGEVLQAVGKVVEVYEGESKRQSWLRTKAAKELNAKIEVL
jgi:hypothetical protein